jgi:hypothetical protein
MAVDMELDEFLGHSGQTTKNTYLGDWKGKTPAQVDTWLNVNAKISALWRHRVPRIAEVEDKQSREKRLEIWGLNANCPENEEVLKNIHKRDRNTGERLFPPTTCPVCMMIEWFWQEVNAGKISWVEPVFEWRAGEGRSEKRQTVHAGGLYNAYGKRNMSDAERKELTDAGIRLTDAWGESQLAKLNYIFVVVNQNDVKSGVQVAVETALLGDRVKSVIRKEIERYPNNPAKGNPIHSPYCIRWKYDEKASEIQKRYDAMPIEIPLSPEVEALIRAEAPDLSSLKGPPRWSEVRENLEAHCLLKDVPWDRFFAKVKDQEEGTDFEFGANAPPAPAPKAPTPPPPAAAKAPVVPQIDKREKEEPVCACDGCGKEIKLSDTKCPHCGHSYVVDAAPTPPPKKLPTRAELAAQAAAAKTQAAAPPATSPSLDKGDQGYVPLEDSSLDF